MKELVSIIIPYYKGEENIKETLLSVCNQTYKNIEIILVNDGSERGFVENLVKENPIFEKIKMLHQENRGQSAARNNGAKIANGKYLLFLDCDDVLDVTFVEKTVAIAQTYADVRIIYSKAKYFGARKGEWKLPDYETKSFLEGNCIPITSLIYKDDFLHIGGFDPNLNFYEDWDLFISIIKNGGKVYRINEYLFFYRIHAKESSLTDKSKRNPNILSENNFKIYCKHYEFYMQNNLDFGEIIFGYRQSEKYKKKYYNAWHRKWSYWVFNKKKYNKIYKNIIK